MLGLGGAQQLIRLLELFNFLIAVLLLLLQLCLQLNQLVLLLIDQAVRF